MAKIKMKVSKKAAEEAGKSGDFEKAPVGVYVARLEKIEQKTSKSTKKPMIEMTWKIVGEGPKKEKPKANYGNIWDYVTFGEDTEWKRAEVMNALGKKTKNGTFELEDDAAKPGSDIGSLVLLRIRADRDLNGDYSPKVGKLLPYVDADSSDAFEDDEEEDDDEDDEEVETEDEETEEEDEEDEDDDEDSEDEDSDDEEDSDSFTKSDLEDMDNKSLGKAAKSLDIDPTEFKGKSARKNLIKAILESQDSDTPF